MIISGLLAVDKPSEHTSFDVIARLRGILGTRKLGHTGTLDPMATGVLPILINRACKTQDLLDNSDKEYIAELIFGISTDTQDITGNILETSTNVPTLAEFEAVVEKFRGEISQIPPMYSAVKQDGRRLYDLARKGIEIERKARNVTIYELEILDFDNEKKSVKIRVKCSKGTYIRTLVDDIGKVLGTFATLSSLRRTMAANVKIEDCLTLEQIIELSKNNEIENYVVPLEKLFDTYKTLYLNEFQEKLFLNGVKLNVNKLNIDSGNYRVYHKEKFLGTAFVDNDELRIQILNL